MAKAKVQNAVEGYAAGTPVTASFPNTPAEGNLIWAYGIGTTAATNASISGWTLAVSTQCGSTKWAALFYKVAGAAESKDVSLVWTGSTVTHVIIEEWGGFVGTPTIDKVANQDYGASATSQTSGTTDATTADSELCIAGFAMGNTFTAPSFSNSFVEEYKGPVGGFLQTIASLVASSAWAAETTCTWTTARICGGLVATFKDGITDTELVVADGSHAHAADGPVLAQAHVLVVQDAAHGHAADGPALIQAHTLAVAGADHAHAADAPVLTIDTELVVDDALHAHTALGGGLAPTGIPDIGAYEYHPPALELEQDHFLAPADATHAHAAETPALTQAHSLVVADAISAHSVDTPVLAQVHTLTVADGSHTHLADAPVLAQVHNLVVADAVHVHAAGAPVLTQAHSLAVAEALHAQTVDSPALIQAYVLALLDALHGHVVDPIILSQAHTLVVADAHHTHIAGAPVVLQAIPTTWQTEAEKFVNEPVVLVEIALDSGTKRLAVDFVRPDNSAPYAGRILSLPNITTSIGDLNRTYEAADIEIIIADPDRDLRTAMQTEGLKNRTLTVKLAFPNEDLAKALTIFSGRIYNYNPLDNMRFSIKAEQYVKNFSEMYPDKLITATDYPNAAEGMVELVIPIVWGTVSSATGPLKTFMVDVTEDAEKHLVGLQYGATLTVANVRINGTLKTVVTHYTITNQTIDGKVHTLIAWEPGVRPTSSDLVTCDAEFLRPSALTARGPVEAFVFFAMNFCGYIFDDFDPTAYADALAIEADRGYALDGIMAERKTLAAWKDEISNEFELDIWYDTATGLIKFQYLGGALDILAAPHYKDYKDILKYTPNQQVDLIGNWCRPGYNYDYALANFQNYQFYEDVPSQTLHGGVYRLDPTLFFVRDSGTAYDLASRKIIRQRNPIAFEKFILPLKTFSLSLGTVVRITHYDGPGPDGYDGDYFQLRRAELDPNNFVLSGEFELVANFYGDDFIFGDEDTLADDWLTASEADKYYGYLCDETTGEFSNGDHGKAMNE